LPVKEPFVYDTDLSGLVYGFVFSADGIGHPVGTEAASSWLKDAAQREQEFIWLHFNLQGTRNWIQEHLDLPDEFFEALKEDSRSTRIEQTERELIAVVNDVVYDLIETTTLQVATLWLSVGPRHLISVRNQPLRSVDKLKEAVAYGGTFSNPIALFIHLLSDQADVLANIIRTVTQKVDRIEDNFLAGRLPRRGNIGGIRRDLVRLQRLLAPEPGSIFRLLNHPPDWIGNDEMQDLHQSTEEFSVVLRDMAGLQERIKLLQEEVVAHIGERTNRTVFVLTAVTVMALPINLAAGLLGMNVGGVPFNQDPDGFWIVVVLLLLITSSAGWLVFRLRNE
jgi:zinc transporter